MESEDRGDDRRDWGAVAHRGQLTATVLTMARAKQEGIPMHREATLVVVLHPDGADDFPVGFVSVQAILDWMVEMSPRSVAVKFADGETSSDLAAILRRAGALH